MEKDLNNKEFYNDMLKEMVKYITVSKTEMSVMQTADAILHEYIKRTEHHIWLVNQCAGILKDVLVENGQDVSEFMARVEYHDYDKLHNPKIIPVYAVACDYYYGDGKKNYEVHEEALYNEFELIAWPEHHRANVHHVAEHYGKRDDENKPFIVPPTQDYLAIGEMIADWMAMSITHGDSARDWYKKTKGVKWTFEPIDEKIIEKFLKAEDEAHNQLAYLRQFKTWEVSTVAMQQAPTISDEDPQENNGVNEGIENFYRELEKSKDIDTKDTLYIEPIEQENLVDDESSELDTYIEQISKLVAEMEPMELKHKLGKYDDDELAIGKISDKNIDMDIVNELMKYPRYLEVLKHWLTVPDYTLLPDLARFGAIIDKIYKFDRPIVAYRGMRVGLVKSYKAQNEMGLTITEEGGMNDDGIEMVLKTPKEGVNEGYNFDYTIDGPLSVSRSIWITKIYGNLIVKTVIPPTAKKLVITNELAYILQKLEARYFNYRPMNLSTRTEIILFPNQTFNFEVVTTNGDISEELAELHEVFYNLQEDTKEVIAGSENSIGHEAFCEQILDTKSYEVVLPFINTSVYKQITDLAKPCYKPIGQNSWEHIQQVYSQASRICKKLFNRTLTPVEYAACLFHDCSVIDSGKDNHNQLSADKAVGILKDLFTPEELNIIHTAIVEHDNQVTSGQWKFSSSASEFVAAGDFNPPDAEWIMNKSYTWGITHGLNHTERIANMTALVKRAYSSTGEMWLHMPNAYKNYFATKINAVKKLFDKITPEEAEKIVMAYRKKHHLSDTDVNLPTSSVEALSTKEYTEADINSVEDLKQFYKHCSYGLIDFKANKPWKETHKNTTFEDWEKEWRLLSVEQLLKFKCGICYDTAKANDYFLTKWKIDHVNLFAYTKRSAGDDYDDDPTHTFTVYKDTDGKWKWLEGSWGSFKNNDWSESSSDALIKNIGKALANEAGVTNLIGVITSWPRDGVSMNEFYHALKDQAIKRYKYEIKPDASYSKEDLSGKESDVSISKYNGSKEELEIIRQCVNLSARSINPKDEGYDKTTFEKLVNNKDKGPYWIIRNGNDIIGSVSIRSSTVGADKVYRCSAINDFAILEKYQGKGFGKKALLAIIAYIRKTMKNKDIGLGVGENNIKAISLYKSVGFKTICGASWGEGDQKFIGYQMLLKYEEPSTEALSPDVKKKKQLIVDYICSICDIIDPSKLNSKRYHRLLDNMNDKEFDQWMHYVKEGKWRLHIVAPNLIINLKNENLLKAADKAKCKLFHRIWMTDHATGRQYLTDNEYLVLTLPVRRQQQFLDEKMSVPDNDRQIDGMTGQVTGDSRSSSITNPEIQILASRKLDATLEELVNVRGGNMLAYGEFKRQAEETGEINMSMFDPNTRSRVAVVGQVLLNSMHIDTNIIE